MHLIRTGLGTILSLLLASPATADEYDDHLSRGDRFAQGEQHREALREYEAAYGLRQSAHALFAIARTHQRLGDAQRALGAYERFLAIGAETDPAERRTAEQEAARLRLAAPAPAPAMTGLTLTPQAVLELLRASREESETDRLRSRNRSLMAGGAVLFSASYFAAFMSGAFLVNSSSRECDGYSPHASSDTMRIAAGTLFIPGAGPIVSSLICRRVPWSVPWTFVDAAGQIGGLVMMIAAAHSNRRLQDSRLAPVSLQLTPYSSGSAHGLQLSGRF
jgi:hypothetical protein